MALIFPLPYADGIRSLRFYEAGSCTGNFIDNEYSFAGGTSEQVGDVQTGATPVTVTDILMRGPISKGSLVVSWEPAVSVSLEDPGVAPAEDGATLIFVVTLAHAPITDDALTLVWAESAVSKTATITGTSTLGGANAANIASVILNRNTGVINITFAALHAPDANSIRATYKYIGTSLSVGGIDGVFTRSGVSGTINYITGEISLTFTGLSIVPYNGGIITAAYGGIYLWSKGIKITSATGGYVEFSFDGTNVHGRLDDGAAVEYFDRYEPGLAIRGSGAFKVEAW